MTKPQASKIKMEKLKKYLKGRILAVIDAANLESSAKDLGLHIDYLKLRDLFSGQQLIQIRNYCVHHYTDNQNNFFTFLKRNGFVLITKPLKIIKQEDIERGNLRKANFDVEIAVDTMIMIDAFDTLVLFSGDSDFNYLVKILRGRGKRIVVVSTKHHVAKELIESANKYYDIRRLKEQIERKQ